mgnify:CR=1 FL=1
MVQLHPFAAVRPAPGHAQAIPSVPYDVVSAAEARAVLEKNPLSFLSVIRSDADLPALPPDDDQVYELAATRFARLLQEGLMVQDPTPGYYVYEIVSGDRVYTGLVACVDVGDYESGVIRRHEQTRYDKERDRTRHIQAVNANTGLVFLLYRDPGGVHARIEGYAGRVVPVMDVGNDRGERHRRARQAGGAGLWAGSDYYPLRIVGGFPGQRSGAAGATGFVHYKGLGAAAEFFFFRQRLVVIRPGERRGAGHGGRRDPIQGADSLEARDAILERRNECGNRRL